MVTIFVSILSAMPISSISVTMRDERDCGAISDRVIRPLSVVFLDRSLLLLAFCRLRMDFRRFQLHRITEVQETGESFRPRRVPLLRDFIRQLRGERDR
jgi:predicted DNA-binding transcriptional regulator YafY